MEKTSVNTEIHMEKGPIGHFGGSYGLSATGEAGLILSVITNFFIGFSTGISYITSRLFGPYDYPRLKQTIHTMVILCTLTGAAFTMIGIFHAETFLVWLDCPEAVMDGAVRYLQICFWGMFPQSISNTGNAILRSMGNTRSPPALSDLLFHTEYMPGSDPGHQMFSQACRSRRRYSGRSMDHGFPDPMEIVYVRSRLPPRSASKASAFQRVG